MNGVISQLNDRNNKSVRISDFIEHEIAGDNIEEDKPHPSSFQTTLQRMNLKPSEAIVVENAPLGIQAAMNSY